MTRRLAYPRTRAAARLLTYADRRALAELDEKPGLGEGSARGQGR